MASALKLDEDKQAQPTNLRLRTSLKEFLRLLAFNERLSANRLVESVLEEMEANPTLTKRIVKRAHASSNR